MSALSVTAVTTDPYLRPHSAPQTLRVDARLHAAEVARFRAKIVTGPDPADCAIWIGALGGDGYGRFYLTRGGVGSCVRAHRYALALAGGGHLAAGALALHECDNPVCVKVALSGCPVQHVVVGDHRQNMQRMSARGRGGGRHLAGHRGSYPNRRAKSVALRAAVADGIWRADAVVDALSGDDPKLF